MAVQGIWSGTVSFSLVAIPVQLVTAVRPGRINFHLLHSKDHSRLVRKMVCPEDGETVPADEIVRGYETAPEHYVLVTEDELESVTPERSRTIEISEFIDLADVDPVRFDHPYYLVPSKGGEKAYRLLAEAMRRTKKAGLARFVLAEREHLVAVVSRQGALALFTLHWDDEIEPDAALAGEEERSVGDEERRMARSIEKMTTDFEPTKYSDGRRDRIRELLERKAKEQAPVEAPALAEDEEGAGPPDLVAALEESMRKVKEGR